jgi:hypothetical protein
MYGNSEFIKTKKERDDVNLAEVCVVVGNRSYIPNWVDMEQTPYNYPRLKIDVTVDPKKTNPVSTSYKAPYNISIKNVVFNPPATIVFWTDNTKTVVKAKNEFYDPEKGIAMAISKKMLGGNEAKYYNAFKPWLKKWTEQEKIDDTEEIEGVPANV